MAKHTDLLPQTDYYGRPLPMLVAIETINNIKLGKVKEVSIPFLLEQTLRDLARAEKHLEKDSNDVLLNAISRLRREVISMQLNHTT